MVAGRERQVNGLRLFFFKVDFIWVYLENSSVPFFPFRFSCFSIEKTKRRCLCKQRLLVVRGLGVNWGCPEISLFIELMPSL